MGILTPDLSATTTKVKPAEPEVIFDKERLSALHFLAPSIGGNQKVSMQFRKYMVDGDGAKVDAPTADDLVVISDLVATVGEMVAAGDETIQAELVAAMAAVEAVAQKIRNFVEAQ